MEVHEAAKSAHDREHTTRAVCHGTKQRRLEYPSDFRRKGTLASLDLSFMSRKPKSSKVIGKVIFLFDKPSACSSHPCTPITASDFTSLFPNKKSLSLAESFLHHDFLGGVLSLPRPAGSIQAPLWKLTDLLAQVTSRNTTRVLKIETTNTLSSY